MSADVVLSAQSLGKKYVIGHRTARRVPTLRDAIVRNTMGVLKAGKDMLAGRPMVAGDTLEEFWALKNVAFSIRRGDVVGILGRNGAGKSTLLKILSRITEPSEGRVEIDGRVASLLEVGTGFHPELTGRENISLNGAVLGMTQTEIRKKFDEIVAFAEVERFLDTPVKRYSSGMYVRLAFAVAAHLEPEILIVDEVLAVGDAEFQKKCLGKMQDVAGHGRTVLFVSHNMSAVADLCTSGMVLANGQVAFSGTIQDAVRYHVQNPNPPIALDRRQDRQGDGRARLRQVRFLNGKGEPVEHARAGCPLSIEFEVDQAGDLTQLALSFNFRDRLGKPITNLSTKSNAVWVGGKQGSIKWTCTIPRLPLMPETYTGNVHISSPQGLCDWVLDAFELGVVGSDFFSENYVPDQGDFMVDHTWQQS